LSLSELYLASVDKLVVNISLSDGKDKRAYEFKILINRKDAEDKDGEEKDPNQLISYSNYYNDDVLSKIGKPTDRPSPTFTISEMTVQGVLSLSFDEPLAIPKTNVNYSECLVISVRSKLDGSVTEGIYKGTKRQL